MATIFNVQRTVSSGEYLVYTSTGMVVIKGDPQFLVSSLTSIIGAVPEFLLLDGTTDKLLLNAGADKLVL